MFACNKVKKNLYGYFYGLLADDKKNSLKTHINKCPSCSNEFNRTRALFEMLALKKETPQPSPEFWQDFRKGLDEKLSINIGQQAQNSIAEKIRQTLALLVQPACRPVLATAFVIIMIVSSGLFFAINHPPTPTEVLNEGGQKPDYKNQTITLALSDEKITEDLEIIDELDSEQGGTGDEYSDVDIIDELDILYEFDPSLFDASEG